MSVEAFSSRELMILALLAGIVIAWAALRVWERRRHERRMQAQRARAEERRRERGGLDGSDEAVIEIEESENDPAEVFERNRRAFLINLAALVALIVLAVLIGRN